MSSDGFQAVGDSSAAATIVVVDDHESTRAWLARLLAAQQHRVLAAETFEEARGLLAENSVDLLVTDVRLNGRNGIQLLATGPSNLAAIVLTGFDDPVLAREARRLGATFLLKPCAPATLLEAVSGQLARRDRVRSDAPVRRWMRQRLASAIFVQVGEQTARIHDVSLGGASFETSQPLPTSPLTVTISAEEAGPLHVSFDVRWRGPLENGAWMSGANVLDGHRDTWRALSEHLSVGASLNFECA